MKKLVLLVLMVLFVFGTLSAVRADNDSTGTPKNKKTVSQVDLNAVSGAVAEREKAITAAYSKLAATISQALIKRQGDLTAAWLKTNTKERRAAIKQAWNDFNKTKKAATKEYKQTIKNIWKTFRQTIKTYKANGNDEPSGLTMGERGDSSLE